MGKIVFHTGRASAAAVAAGIEDTVGWASNTGLSVPDRSSSWTSLAILRDWVVVRKVMRASTVVSSLVPDVRSWASNTLSGVRVEERSSWVAHALSKSLIERESGRAAVALFGVVVPVSIVRAAFASLGG